MGNIMLSADLAVISIAKIRKFDYIRAISDIF